MYGPGSDIAAARRHDAGGHGATKTERISDGDDPITDTRFAIGEIHEGEALAGFDLDEREVGLRIGADNFRLVDRSIIGRNLDGLGAIDDVIVRHGIAIGRNEEAGTLAGHVLAAARLGLRHALLTELLEELLEGDPRTTFALVVVTHARCFRALVDLDADGNHGRLYFCNDIGESGRRLNAVRERGRRESWKVRPVKA